MLNVSFQSVIQSAEIILPNATQVSVILTNVGAPKYDQI